MADSRIRHHRRAHIAADEHRDARRDSSQLAQTLFGNRRASRNHAVAADRPCAQHRIARGSALGKHNDRRHHQGGNQVRQFGQRMPAPHHAQQAHQGAAHGEHAGRVIVKTGGEEIHVFVNAERRFGKLRAERLYGERAVEQQRAHHKGQRGKQRAGHVQQHFPPLYRLLRDQRIYAEERHHAVEPVVGVDRRQAETNAERHDDPRVKQHQKADIRMRLKLSLLRPAEAEQAERAAPGQNHKAVKRGNRIGVPRQHVGGKEAVTDKRNEQECAFILRDGKQSAANLLCSCLIETHSILLALKNPKRAGRITPPRPAHRRQPGFPARQRFPAFHSQADFRPD